MYHARCIADRPPGTETETMVRWILAALHLLALGIGLGAVWTRARALRGASDHAVLRRAFAADGLWGLAALLWISTGLIRAFGGFEKGTAYYLHSNAFLVKMALLALILGLEVWPMVTLIRWRRAASHNEVLDLHAAPALARISLVQAFL
ncbi:MAG TPA: DUF2214 family protein, partial [Longimicrobiaceae bacterium]